MEDEDRFGVFQQQTGCPLKREPATGLRSPAPPAQEDALTQNTASGFHPSLTPTGKCFPPLISPPPFLCSTSHFRRMCTSTCMFSTRRPVVCFHGHRTERGRGKPWLLRSDSGTPTQLLCLRSSKLLGSHCLTKKRTPALAGVVQRIEHRLSNQRVTSSIPSQGKWVAGQVPSRGHERGNHTLTFLSLSFSFPSPLSKNK